MNQRRVHDLLASETGRQTFLEWLEHPVTQLMLGAARERAKPKSPYPPVTAEFRLGESKGAFDIIDFLSSPMARHQDAENPPAPQAMYQTTGRDEE